ncbi:MAG: hypothetical protein RIQ41_427 [Candidatus Parcubacteria bacterium]|jgi:hypothetical protein
MGVIRYMLGVVIKLALALIIFSFAVWLVNLLLPQFKLMDIVSGKIFSTDWLPAPKQYGGLFGNRTATTGGMNGKLYVHGDPYQYNPNQFQNQYISYGSSTTQLFAGNTTTYLDRSIYVRNLSLYEGGSISYGSVFVGEAQGTLFKNGLFPIYIVDSTGRVLSATQAINTGPSQTQGWFRFQVTIPSTLPANTSCLLVFVSSNDDRVQMRIPVRCN